MKFRKLESVCAGTRREFLWQTGAGFAGVALAALLESEGFFSRVIQAAAPIKLPPRRSKVKSCIFLFMYGGPSQMDLFDYKPELQKRDGKTVNLEIRRRDVKPGTLLASKRTWAQYGESGLWCSDALPHLARHMDKLAMIKSLYADSFAHGSAMIQMNTGRVIQGHPS